MGLKWYSYRIILSISLVLTVGCDNIQPLIDAADVKVSSLTQNGTYVRVDGASLSWFETAKIENSVGESLDASIAVKGDDYLILQITSGLGTAGGTSSLVVGQSYIIVLDAGLKTPFRSEPVTLLAGAAPAVSFFAAAYYVNSSSYANLSGACSIDAQPVSLTLSQGSSNITGTAMCSGGVWSAAILMTGFSEGAFYAYASFTDGTTTASASANGYQDTIAPLLSSITGVPTGANLQPSMLVSFTYSDAGGGNLYYDVVSGNACPAAGSLSSVYTVGVSGSYALPTIVFPAADGMYTFCVMIQDLAGNASAMQAFTWEKDTTAPSFTSMQVIDDLSSPGYARNPSWMRFVATASYTEPTVWLEVYETANCTGTTILAHNQLVPNIDNAISLSNAGIEGTRSVSARMMDGVGNWSTCTSTDFIVDLTAPVVTLFNLNEGDLLSPKRTVPLSINTTDNLSGAESFLLYAGSGCTGSVVNSGTLPLVSPNNMFAHGLPSTASQTYSVRVLDKAQNSVCSSDVTFTHAMKVLRAYSASAPYFNDWITTNGATACTPALTVTNDNCTWAGDKRKVVTDETSCAGLSMSDNFVSGGAFNWNCQMVDTGGGVMRAVFYSALKGAYGLRDLMESDGGGGYRWKSGAMNLSGGMWGAESSIWSAGVLWNDIFQSLPANDTATLYSLTSTGTIYAFQSDMRTYGYSLNSPNISIVGLNSARLLGPTTGNPTFLIRFSAAKPWIEANMDARGASTNSATYLIQAATGCSFARINRIQGIGTFNGIGGAGVCNGMQISDVFLRGNQATTYAGIGLTGSSGGLVITRTNVEKFGYGIQLTSQTNAVLNKVVVSDNMHAGIRVDNPATQMTMQDVVSTNNASHGFMLVNVGAAKILAQDLLAGANAENGFNFSYSTNPDSTFVNLASFGSYSNGLLLDQWSDSKFHYYTSGVTSAPGISVSSSSHNNVFSQVYSGGSPSFADIADSTLPPYLTSYLGTIAHEGLCVGTYLASSCLTMNGQPVGETNVNLSGSAPSIGTPSAYSWNLNLFNHEIGLQLMSGYNTVGPYATDLGSMTWGNCPSGTCSQWDWRLRSTDTLWRGAAADGSGSNAIPSIVGGACPAELNGNVTLTAGAQTYLKNAVEVSAPNRPFFNRLLGDHDGLCESGEVCMAAPNLGYYQGSPGTSPVLDSCTFTSGTVTGVTMFMYPTNGI